MNQTQGKSLFQSAIVGCITTVFGLQPLLAGTQGSYMNSAGYGKAADSVVFAGVTNKATSIAMYNPCAAVNAQTGNLCAYKTGLPVGTPSTVFCQSKGGPNYVWSIQSYVTGGATADNPELEGLFNLTPQNCAEVKLDTSATFFPDGKSGLIKVETFATAGAAIALRGYEFLPGGTPENLENLKTNSVLRFDLKLAGPFNLNANDCTAVTVPFTTESGHENLFVVADTVALSSPFVVSCPGDVTFGCGDSVVYPPVTVTGGCGTVNVAYDPPANELPVGVTTVTATASDQSGNTSYCSFTATRSALTFHGFQSPINGFGGSCSSPFFTANRGSVIPVKFDTACNNSAYLAGTPTLGIKSCASGAIITSGNFQLVANEWHFNWDTSGLPKGVYQLDATLQDGTHRLVFVRIK